MQSEALKQFTFFLPHKIMGYLLVNPKAGILGLKSLAYKRIFSFNRNLVRPAYRLTSVQAVCTI